MIQLKVRSSVDGAVRTVDTAAVTLSDLTFPLEQWNKYKRKDVQQKFDQGGPGWPEKKSGAKMGPMTASQSAASDARVKQVADEILRTKLRAELRRAQRKYARGKGSAKTMERRYAVLKVFEQMADGGKVVADFADTKLAKSVGGLRDRHARASAKAKSRPLGRIAASMKSKVQKYSVEVYSTIPWAGAQNEGDTVGNGAVLPERRFLEVTDEDIAVLLMLINLYVASRG